MGVVDLRRSLPFACAIFAAVMGALAAPAVASFPGRNGNLLLRAEDGFGRGAVTYSIATLNLRTGGERTTRSCQSVNPEIGDNRGCLLSSPAAAPDGRIALVVTEYSGPGRGQSYLEILTMSGRLLGRVPTERFDRLAWSPSGTSLLAIRANAPDPGLFVIGLDGRRRQVVMAGDVISADWSSRGEIAFSLANDVFVTRLGGQPRRVGVGASPSWSPTGRRLAFRALSGRRGQSIVVTKADGTRRRFITRQGAGDPHWSPDGRRVAFRTGSIHTVRSDGRGLRRLRPNDGCDGFLCGTDLVGWLPLPRRR